MDFRGYNLHAVSHKRKEWDKEGLNTARRSFSGSHIRRSKGMVGPPGGPSQVYIFHKKFGITGPIVSLYSIAGNAELPAHLTI